MAAITMQKVFRGRRVRKILAKARNIDLSEFDLPPADDDLDIDNMLITTTPTTISGFNIPLREKYPTGISGVLFSKVDHHLEDPELDEFEKKNVEKELLRLKAERKQIPYNDSDDDEVVKTTPEKSEGENEEEERKENEEEERKENEEEKMKAKRKSKLTKVMQEWGFKDEATAEMWERRNKRFFGKATRTKIKDPMKRFERLKKIAEKDTIPKIRNDIELVSISSRSSEEENTIVSNSSASSCSEKKAISSKLPKLKKKKKKEKIVKFQTVELPTVGKGIKFKK